MFPLYEHTRRQICMAAFLGLCVLPTVVVAGWSLARRLPWHKQAEQQRLSQELGLDVSIESMKHTRPGVVRYTGFRLTDPETGQELFRCSELTARWTSFPDKHGRTRPVVVLAAIQAESATGAWPRLQDMLRRRLECQSGRPEIDIRLTADPWTLHDGNETQVLRISSADTGIGLMENGIQAQLAFRFAEANSPQPMRMGIVRNRLISPPSNEFNLETGPNAVPCRLLAACLPELNALGPNCCFSGNVWTCRSFGGWSGELSGRLIHTDLRRLAGETMTAALDGTGDITIFNARFQNGRIDELSGRIVCGPGAFSWETYAALVQTLRLKPLVRVPAAGEPIAFDRMGLDFSIDCQGIRITGGCAGVPGAIAVSAGRGILGEPSQPQSVAALIQALAPGSGQAGSLARLLPVVNTRNPK
jgi:hypothetical protein